MLLQALLNINSFPEAPIYDKHISILNQTVICSELDFWAFIE